MKVTKKELIDKYNKRLDYIRKCKQTASSNEHFHLSFVEQEIEDFVKDLNSL